MIDDFVAASDDDNDKPKNPEANFGKQSSLFPMTQAPAGIHPNARFPANAEGIALFENAMMGREVNRHNYKIANSSKTTNQDVSTTGRYLRRDCFIPMAVQIKKVKIYAPSGKRKYITRLAHFFFTDEQRYQLDIAFPDWRDRCAAEKFNKPVGKKTTKFQRNLLEAGIFENGKIKCCYPRFFSHDKDFGLPVDWIPPEDRNTNKP